MDKKTVLYFGSLLHDVGKVVYRGMSGRGTHSRLGAEFVGKEVAALNDAFETPEGKAVVEQIRYHHAREMASAAALDAGSLAYITYFADNISAGMDRKNEGDEDVAAHFDRSVNLRKIFNILNGHHDDAEIPHRDYNEVRELLKKQLSGIQIASQEVNSLLNVLEATTSDIPSSTNTSELVDVSLYDHAKTTAGLAACIYDSFEEKGVSDYRAALFSGNASKPYYDENLFLLTTCDMSGIQDFIYNISGSGALKQLRARSLYLELMMEHVVDELLERLGLCRANALYIGGGHAYLLLPNTQRALETLREFQDELKRWFIDEHGTELFVAFAGVPCSANDLANEGADKRRFSRLFTGLSAKLSDAKAARYTAADIRQLNFGGASLDTGRECRECHRSGNLVDGGEMCSTCKALHDISSELISKDVFAVFDELPEGVASKATRLALPFGRTLVLYDRASYLKKSPEVKRLYTKNSWDAGLSLSTHIWLGDYTADMQGKGFSSYAEQGETLEVGRGVKRLGVLRADVDNLGAAFASGIPAEKASISRTATLSRALSYFFKHEINDILAEGNYKAQVIYSGGDDLFIVGNWSDVLYAALDIRNALSEFTGNDSLTISAGIGMFDEKYPIARMAAETGELEDAAKMHAETDNKGNVRLKDAVALWRADSVFSWADLANVVEPRMREVTEAFRAHDKGKAFVYKMVSLLRNYDQAVSAPRLAYLLARSFEDDKQNRDALCSKFYAWAADKKQRRCLVAALEWYVYSIRER